MNTDVRKFHHVVFLKIMPNGELNYSLTPSSQSICESIIQDRLVSVSINHRWIVNPARINNKHAIILCEYKIIVVYKNGKKIGTGLYKDARC